MNGRFGTTIAVVDINADGVRDLAVSAPSVGSEDLDYEVFAPVKYCSINLKL